MKLILLLFSCILFFSCGTQEAVSKKKIDSKTTFENNKWLVLCLSPVEEFRTEFETQVKQQLEFHEVHSQTSVEYIPQSLTQEKETQAKLAKLIESLPEKGFTTLLISTLENTEKTKIDADGYFGDFTLFHYVTNVFTINEEGSKLVWSMCLCIYEYQLPEVSIQDFARIIVGKLAADKIIPDTKMELIELYTL